VQGSGDRLKLSADAPIFTPAPSAEFRADAPYFEPAPPFELPAGIPPPPFEPPAGLPVLEAGPLEVAGMAPPLLVMVPPGAPPPEVLHGYMDASGGWAYWCPMPEEVDVFPEVIPGLREGEFIGLTSIAEMGEWVVLREKKPKTLPFFWNMMTGEKSWEAPEILKELGVEETLQKWSKDLPETGIELSPEVRNPDSFRRRKNWRQPRDEGSPAVEQITAPEENVNAEKVAPPGFASPE